MDLASAADDIAVHTARSLMPRNTAQDRKRLALALTRKGLHLQATDQAAAEPLLDEGRKCDAAAAQEAVAAWELVQAGSAPTLVTVATSLAVAAQELGAEHVPTELTARITRPAREVAFVAPSDRCSVDQAPDYAKQLAEICVALLPKRRIAALRLGLEAHYLFAIASQAKTPAMRYQLNIYGPAWAGALLACSRAYQADGRSNMALDLAAWGGGVVTQLLPFSALDTELRPLLRACMEQHGQMCIATGDTRAGEEILQQVRALWND